VEVVVKAVVVVACSRRAREEVHIGGRRGG
jgi:hypothetical protein